MFAVAAWNDREKKLLLIRDRIGVKPLYYYWDGSILLFASEIKALLASNLFPRRLNRQAIWDYLTYRYVPGPETMWQHIWKTPPGTYAGVVTERRATPITLLAKRRRIRRSVDGYRSKKRKSLKTCSWMRSRSVCSRLMCP